MSKKITGKRDQGIVAQHEHRAEASEDARGRLGLGVLSVVAVTVPCGFAGNQQQGEMCPKYGQRYGCCVQFVSVLVFQQRPSRKSNLVGVAAVLRARSATALLLGPVSGRSAPRPSVAHSSKYHIMSLSSLSSPEDRARALRVSRQQRRMPPITIATSPLERDCDEGKNLTTEPGATAFAARLCAAVC